MELAIHGGRPVSSRPWPAWPPASESAAAILAEVATSGRWSPTGISSGTESYDRRFSRAFADYCGAGHCVTAVNGTTALRLALEVVGIGAGDEVIVPAMTWIADLDSVLSVGAVPVLADIDPATLCLCPEAMARAVSPRTRAVIVVHLGGAVADLSGILDRLDGTGIHLIEDAAQAHGASWRGARVGSIGVAGAFSMHNSKLLTSGEGGAVVTSSAEVAGCLEELRANGRRPREGATLRGEMEYRHANRITGTNACPSEFQSAVLLDMLPRLDALNADCAANARRLEAGLGALGFVPQATSPGSERVYSNFSFAVPEAVLDSVPLALFADALSAETGAAFKRLYEPLDRSPMFKPESRPSWRWFARHREAFSGGEHASAARAHETMLMLPHPYLRAGAERNEDILRAVEKVLAGLPQLRSDSRSGRAAGG